MRHHGIAHQAREQTNPGFSAESLAELAASIKAGNGVKTPISVRSKNAEGKYVINHGARRYRASKLAGMRTIAAFFDDSHDQAVENIQREAFTPMEVALFIQKREGMGDERKTIAKRLGKSRAYVTIHAALLELPAVLRAAYDSGRCQDSTLLYKLANLAKDHSEEVTRFIEQTPEISRSSVEAFDASLRAERSVSADGAPVGGTSSSAAPRAGSGASEKDEPHGESGSGPALLTSREETSSKARARARTATVVVTSKEQRYVLRLDLPPSALHLGWIEDPATGEPSEVELADLRIESIVAP